MSLSFLRKQESRLFHSRALDSRFHACAPCLRRPARRTSSLAGESGFAQAGGTLWRESTGMTKQGLFGVLNQISEGQAEESAMLH